MVLIFSVEKRAMVKKTILQESPATSYHETALPCDPLAFETVVTSRRAVRRFTSDLVPEAVVRRCLSLAMLAPTSSNMQPGEFYWVRDPAKKKAMVEALLSQPAAATAAEIVVLVVPHAAWRSRAKANLDALVASAAAPPSALDYYRRLIPFAYTVGPLSLLGRLKGGFLGLMRVFRVTPKVPSSFADVRGISLCSAGMVAQTFMLAVRAHGFDSCPIGGLDESRVRRILGLPRSTEVVMAVALGKRAEGGVYGPRVRIGESESIHEV
jgi:nitroreductase